MACALGTHSMFRLLPRPPNCLDEIGLGDLLPGREVTSGDLGVDLDAGVGWNEVFCKSDEQTRSMCFK